MGDGPSPIIERIGEDRRFSSFSAASRRFLFGFRKKYSSIRNRVLSRGSASVSEDWTLSAKSNALMSADWISIGEEQCIGVRRLDSYRRSSMHWCFTTGSLSPKSNALVSGDWIRVDEVQCIGVLRLEPYRRSRLDEYGPYKNARRCRFSGNICESTMANLTNENVISSISFHINSSHVPRAVPMRPM